jgi:hypothetical protein
VPLVVKSFRFLRFWRGLFGDGLAHYHDTFWMAIQRGRYRQIQVVAFRSSPTVLAETPVDWSALTRIRSGKPPRARWSAATFFGLYRMMTSPIRQALAPLSPPAQQNYITCSGPTQRHLVAVVPLVAAVVEEEAA